MASLTLGFAQGQARWMLDDHPLQGGDVVEVCASGGWIAGRFECDSGTANLPTLFFSIELEGGGVEERSLELPERALVRRRSRSE